MFTVELATEGIIKHILVGTDIKRDDGEVELQFIDHSADPGTYKKKIIFFHDDIEEWLTKNIKGKYAASAYKIIFENEDDALLFKMVWL